ncbi:hypothetical protein B0J14DRAFT_121586 [Halenospora varia]|nr:hypothetical protein B0J14DRAFT_121586 [Halenospora varia]
MAISRAFIIAIAGLAASVLATDGRCNHDNCYRAFNGDGHTIAAASLCSRFTTATTTTTNDIPTYVTQFCQPSAISSVCSCAYPAPSAPPCPTTGACYSSLLSSISASVSSSVSSSVAANVVPCTTQPTITPPTTTFQTSTITAAAQGEYGPGCNADNCLRAFDNGHAQQYCSGYTAGVTGAYPFYATMCSKGNIASEISSACTCLNYKSTTSTTSMMTQASHPPQCHGDNCLRALIREGGAGATPFCSNFLTATVTAVSALPTYASMCDNKVVQVSSACSCLPFATS